MQSYNSGYVWREIYAQILESFQAILSYLNFALLTLWPSFYFAFYKIYIDNECLIEDINSLGKKYCTLLLLSHFFLWKGIVKDMLIKFFIYFSCTCLVWNTKETKDVSCKRD